MGKHFEALNEHLTDFITRQPMFFVGTAPLNQDGLVNISPKDGSRFKVLGPRRVAYLDRVGSGIETVAHIRENQRITLMFCAFEGSPLIVRLYGKGSIVFPQDDAWADRYAAFDAEEGARSIITVDVSRVGTSCGFGVPVMSFERHRTQLDEWIERKSDQLDSYREKFNMKSLEGLPGLPATND
ncbi:MAG: pyridoxamine 5'-phosphate oxidase family protein [Myxococcota bacterium]